MSSRSPGYCLDKCVGDHPKRLHTSSIIRKDRKHFRKSIKLEATEYNHVLICGYHVQLPRSIIPYPSQRTMIAKILTSLKNKLNALIESPTGSGKTLGLLSASCTWLLKYKEERERSIKDCKLCHTRNGYELDNGNAGHQTTSNENSLPENQETSFANQLSDNDLVSEDSLRSMDEEFESDFVPVDVHPFLQRLSAQLKADHTESVKMDGNEASPHSHTCLPKVVIYYGTRTHKQVGQVIHEFSRLPHGVNGSLRHTILASREQSCVNKQVRASNDMSAACKELIGPNGVGCQYRNSMSGRYEKPEALRRLIFQNSESSVWDIESLTDSLRTDNSQLCPYFSSTRIMTQDADIVFCPFNYMIDPIIRDNSDVTLNNSIVILDEAHNVEDVCRDAVSYSFSEKELVTCRADFLKKAGLVDEALQFSNQKLEASEDLEVVDGGQLENKNEKLKAFYSMYKIMNKFMSTVLDWFSSVSSLALTKQTGRDRFTHNLSWEKLYLSLEEVGLTAYADTSKSGAYAALMEAFSGILANKSEKSENETELSQFRPSSYSVVCVEKLLYFFRFYFKGDNRTTYVLFVCVDKPFDFSSRRPILMDENIVISEDIASPSWQRSGVKSGSCCYDPVKPGYRVVINLWCMRPALAYNDAFRNCRSVILASGTLCPTDTFRTELGTEFQQQMEGSQVIPEDQMFAAVIPSGPSGKPLCATYRNINSGSVFLNELSLVILSVCKIVPKGILCFLTSYKVMDQLYEYMEMEGILRDIQTIKLVLREPRRSSEMNATMKQYEDAITNCSHYGISCSGAVLFAVFRGKVSEGIDFTDDSARCVISVGIPFPSAMDEQVSEKKNYNNTNSKKMQILGGDEWYITQAYRALNQALGRCLRHRNDWGVILLVDQRLRPSKSNPNYDKISKWIRARYRNLNSYQHFEAELAKFVSDMQLTSVKEENHQLA